MQPANNECAAIDSHLTPARAPPYRSGVLGAVHMPAPSAPPRLARPPRPLPRACSAPALAAPPTTAASCRSTAATAAACPAYGQRSHCRRCVWGCHVLWDVELAACQPRPAYCCLAVPPACLQCCLACSPVSSSNPATPLLPTRLPQLPTMQSVQPNVPNSAPLWLPHPPSGGGVPAQPSTASGGSGASAAAGLAHGWGPLPAHPPGFSSNEGGSSEEHGAQGRQANRDRMRLEQLVEADW